MLFTVKGNVTITERSAHAPIAHVVVRSCRKFEKHWSELVFRICWVRISDGAVVILHEVSLGLVQANVPAVPQ
jgi:hypothetical protein